MRSALLSVLFLFSAAATAGDLQKITHCQGNGNASVFRVLVLEFTNGHGQVAVRVEESQTGGAVAFDELTAEAGALDTGVVYTQSSSKFGRAQGVELFVSNTDKVSSTLTLTQTPLTVLKAPLTLPVTCN